MYMICDYQRTLHHWLETVLLTTGIAGMNSVIANYSQFLRKLLDEHDTCTKGNEKYEWKQA